MPTSSTRRLAYLGLLVALAVVLTRFASVRVAIGGIEGVRLGLGHFPLIMAGVLYGPLAGAAAGAVADITGFFISPMGPYMPHFTLTAALTGALPALFLAVMRPRRAGAPSLARLAAAIALSQGIVAVILVPYFLKALFGLPPAVTVPPKVVEQAIVIPSYALLLHLLLRRLTGLVPVWERPDLARNPTGSR
ncbi:MAG: folate family ECF transporter S component [Bacillota bacterium]|jgi:ECF transporter S component (folate family)